MKGMKIFRPRLQLWLALAMFALGSGQSFAQICITTATGDQEEGTSGGYRHEVWNDFNGGSSPVGTGCMTLGSTKAAFSANWSNVHNFLARRGLGYDQTKKHYEIGSLNTTFDVTYNPTCASGGNSYMGVYGWTYDSTKASPNDLVEYYIIEDWCNWNPSLETGAQNLGTIFGGQYDVIKVTRTGKPSIKAGSDDFVQYFSIRKQTRNSGAINVTEHFYNWEKLGLPLGNLHEVSMLVEGYKDSGSATFNSLDVYKTSGVYATQMSLSQNTYALNVGDKTSRLEFVWSPAGSILADYKVTSSNENVVSIGVYKGNYFLQGNGVGTATLTATSLSAPRPGQAADTATVTVSNGASPLVAQSVEFRARGTTGTEKVNLLLNGSPVGKEHLLTTDFKVYKDTFFGAGDVTVEFVNDDNVPNGGRDVRLDYISINGAKRETEAMAVNSAAYVNGVCGGGGYTEWLNCNGAVNFGRVELAHKLTVRARGNAGGEHLTILVDGQPVNTGWNLTTSFKEYSVTLNRADGDINVKYDNDGGTKDVVVDWLKVDNQKVRQAENMQYNTGVFANGKCGGGSKSEWMHCNGVIGFGKISDNFN